MMESFVIAISDTLRPALSFATNSSISMPWIFAACHRGSPVEEGQPRQPIPMDCKIGINSGYTSTI